MFVARLDHWIGRTLFLPPIVKLCQLTRQSQHAVARLFWFIAALDAFYRADTLLGSVIWGAISVIMMVTAARRADQPSSSFLFFRMLALVALAIDLVQGLAGQSWAGIEFWIFVLIAEYAAIIRTIPPSVKGTPRQTAATNPN